MSQLVYKITRPLARQALKIYFKSIYFSNVENLPLDKPVILASNHPTAFVEPIIMACFLPKPVSYLVRGDFFKNYIFRKILEAYNMVPVFRFIDGYSNMKKNASSFEYCNDLLKDNRIIMVMVEGLTHHDKKLWPLKKGAARMAFETIERYGLDLDIQIVPVGINYTNATKFRSEVMIDFGKSISVNDYWKIYQEHPQKALRLLTKDLFPLMKEHIIEIDNQDDTSLIENALEIYRNNQTLNVFYQFNTSSKRLLGEKKIADNINSMNAIEKREFQLKVNDYFKSLYQYKISDFAIAQPEFYNLRNWITLVCLFLPAMLGWLVNIIPFSIGHFISKRYIVYIEFFTPVRLALVFVNYIMIIFGCLILAFFTRNAYITCIPFILLVLGLSFLYFYDTFQKWNVTRKFYNLPSNLREKFFRQRIQIVDSL